MQDVQSLGKEMQDGFATESLRRQEDYWNMEKAMTAKMQEGFRSEQLPDSRHKMRYDRQMVQTDLYWRKK